MAHGKISRQKNRERRKLEKMSARRARKEAYAAMAQSGDNRKKKGLDQTSNGLAKDHKQVDLKAALARPNFRRVPGWVNRKAILLDPGLWSLGAVSSVKHAARLLGIQYS